MRPGARPTTTDSDQKGSVFWMAKKHFTKEVLLYLLILRWQFVCILFEIHRQPFFIGRG